MNRDIINTLTFKGARHHETKNTNEAQKVVKSRNNKKDKNNDSETIYDIIKSYKIQLIEAKKNPKMNITKKQVLEKTKKELIDYLKDKYSGRSN